MIYYSEEECVLCSLSKLDDWLRFNGIQEDESFILCPIVAPLAEDMLEEQRLEVAAYNSNKSNTYHVIVDYDNKYTTRFMVREKTVYTVEDNFPRITRKSLPCGVSSITYVINLDVCNDFVLSCEEFIGKLT